MTSDPVEEALLRAVEMGAVGPAVVMRRVFPGRHIAKVERREDAFAIAARVLTALGALPEVCDLARCLVSPHLVEGDWIVVVTAQAPAG